MDLHVVGFGDACERGWLGTRVRRELDLHGQVDRLVGVVPVEMYTEIEFAGVINGEFLYAVHRAFWSFSKCWYPTNI